MSQGCIVKAPFVAYRVLALIVMAAAVSCEPARAGNRPKTEETRCAGDAGLDPTYRLSCRAILSSLADHGCSEYESAIPSLETIRSRMEYDMRSRRYVYLGRLGEDEVAIRSEILDGVSKDIAFCRDVFAELGAQVTNTYTIRAQELDNPVVKASAGTVGGDVIIGLESSTGAVYLVASLVRTQGDRALSSVVPWMWVKNGGSSVRIVMFCSPAAYWSIGYEGSLFGAEEVHNQPGFIIDAMLEKTTDRQDDHADMLAIGCLGKLYIEVNHYAFAENMRLIEKQKLKSKDFSHSKFATDWNGRLTRDHVPYVVVSATLRLCRSGSWGAHWKRGN